MSASRLTLTRTASAALVPLVFASGVQASGFAVPEISIAGLGLANAMVANTSDAGAIAYNPAAMAFLGDASVGGGLMFINPNNSVSDTLGNPGKSFDGETPDWIGTVMGHGHVKMNDALLVGLSVNTPFGLETKWPSEAFAKGFGGTGMEPTHSKLELITASPSLTWRLNDNAALSAGFDLYWVRDLKFDTASTVICCGDGTGTGFHLAGLYRQGPWSFGASYYSTSNIDIEDGKVENSLASIEAETQIELPWRAQIGVGYQATETVNLEFDITRTGWSSFDEIEIWASDPFIRKYGFDDKPIVNSTNDWDDATAYRFGLTWDLSEATRLRFGYSFDETPQDDDHFSARIPDADRHLFSIGIRQALSNGWEVEGGYMYVKLNDREIDSSKLPDGDPNGTMLYNGDYEGHSHLVGVGVTKRF